MQRVYTSRSLLGLTWAEFIGLVKCLELDCGIHYDGVHGDTVTFSPKDMAKQLTQLCEMSSKPNPSAIYSAMTSALRAINETLRGLPELGYGQSASLPLRTITVYQRSK